MDEKDVYIQRNGYDKNREAALKAAVQLCHALSTQGVEEAFERFLTKRNDELEKCLENFLFRSYVSIEHVDFLSRQAKNYDYDPQTPGNGYRSIVTIFDTALLRVLSCLYENVHSHEWFRLVSSSRLRDCLIANVELFCSICESIDLLIAQHEVGKDNNLFPAFQIDDSTERLVSVFEDLDLSSHYGNAVGFQFTSSVQVAFVVITTALAAFATLKEEGKSFPSKIAQICGYVTNARQRSAYVARLYRGANLELFRSFWSLLESRPLNVLHRCVGGRIAVNETIPISAQANFFLPLDDGNVLKVSAPTVYTGSRQLMIRYLSAIANQPNALSKNLVLHCHGGGFIATSTETHQVYLKLFAKELRCPIVSVEYSLAPENPYPRAAEEVLYAYGWCLENKQRLGWTGETLCLVGESAGGVLLTSLCLKLIELKVQRLPDALVTIYSPMMMQILPSPSRMLSLFDPIITLGITYHCMDAYTRGLKNGKLTISNYEKIQNGSTIDVMKLYSGEVLRKGRLRQNVSLDNVQLVEKSACQFNNDFVNFLSSYGIREEYYQGRVSTVKTVKPCTRWSLTRNAKLLASQFLLDTIWLLGQSAGMVKNTFNWFANLFLGRQQRVMAVERSDSSTIASIRQNCAQNGAALLDPCLSPLLASERALQLLPPVSIIACQMDPLLDDSISFAKRLRDARCEHTLHLLEMVPHGFMNLIPGSDECKEATLFCIRRIRQYLA